MSYLYLLVYLVRGLVLIEAAERCYINAKDDDRTLVICTDYCCGNGTYQYCCNNCWASVKSAIWCNQTAVISGLVLLFVGVLFVLLLISVCTQFSTISEWTQQHLFGIQRTRIGTEQPEPDTNQRQLPGNNTYVHETCTALTDPPKPPAYSECVSEEPPPTFVISSPPPPIHLDPTTSTSEFTSREWNLSGQIHQQTDRTETPPPNYNTLTPISSNRD